MRPSKHMRASSAAERLFIHLTNSAISVRNVLEDGIPEQKISVEELKRAIGEKNLLLIEKILELCIDDESESERVKQRKAEREAKAGKVPASTDQPAQAAPTAETPTASKRPQRRKRA